MAVRIRQNLESLVQCLELGGFKVHSVEKLSGAPGRDVDIHLQNSLVLKWDVTTKSIWAEGPSRACRNIEQFLYAICEGTWFERTEAIQRRRLMIYLRKRSRQASVKFAEQRKIIAARSRIVAAQTAAQSRVIGTRVAAQSRVLSAKVLARSRIVGGRFAVAAAVQGRAAVVACARKSIDLRNQLASLVATRAPRFARYFYQAARVQPDDLPPPTSETRP